jgi:hypothetical protein
VTLTFSVPEPLLAAVTSEGFLVGAYMVSGVLSWVVAARRLVQNVPYGTASDEDRAMGLGLGLPLATFGPTVLILDLLYRLFFTPRWVRRAAYWVFRRVIFRGI